jgi:pyoverdine/dityrosine biosynthesis protein Dit1/AcrR family transcriptional regulator
MECRNWGKFSVDLDSTRSRQRILEAAVILLQNHGFAGRVVEESAKAASVPVSNAKLFFRNDEELILALYLRLASDLQRQAAALAPGKTGDRFRALMLSKLELAAPYRQAFAGLFAKMLDPRTNIGVLSAQTELVRLRSRAAFDRVVNGATDAPEPSAPLIQSLYGAHLALMLVWSQDHSPELRSTQAALDLVCKLTSMLSRFDWVPQARTLLENLGAIFGPLVEQPADAKTNRTAREILNLVFRNRRLLAGAQKCPDAAKDGHCEQCLEPHQPLVRRFVQAGLPVHFVLPAFPAKSPNPEKVLGPLPDMAEELALGFLNELCQKIKKIYPPGAKITICSDGLVFSDLVGVTDADVRAYGKKIEAIIALCQFESLETFHLQDLYDRASSGEQMRDSLGRHYAEALEVIRERLHSNDSQESLFNGIQRFLFEDRVVVEKGKSRNRIRSDCKERTYEVVRRSDAWGRLLADCFPASLRLSIHPQPWHSEKIGILLGESQDVWLTPWHAVALKENGKFRFAKRAEAEAAGAMVVLKEGQPSYMEIPE